MHEVHVAKCVLMFLSDLDVFGDLLLYKAMATWNLFVLHDEKEKFCWR